MGLPHLLLVDDSEAILNFEKAVLAGHYLFSTAKDGVEALDKIRSEKYDGVLLDLSMPRMDGDEVLKAAKADADLEGTPFLVISSEKERAEACLRAGADGIIHKPILADDLRAKVALMLERAQERARSKTSPFLLMAVNTQGFALPLKPVVAAHSQPITRALAPSHPFMDRSVDYYGKNYPILDMAEVLGVPHRKSLEDRKLVFLKGAEPLALCVDEIFEVEELSPEAVRSFAQEDGADKARLLQARIETNRGAFPVLEPEMLFDPQGRERLHQGYKGGTWGHGEELGLAPRRDP